MPDLSHLFEAEAANRKAYPVAYAALDLCLKGHLTYEEFTSIQKAEVIGKMFDKKLEESAKETAHTVQGVSKDDLEQTKKVVDAVAKKWIPRQINNTLIRVLPADIKAAPPAHANDVVCSVRITLLDVENSLQQSLATDIILAVEETTPGARDYLQNALNARFHDILLQLLLSINSNTPHTPEGGKDGSSIITT